MNAQKPTHVLIVDDEIAQVTALTRTLTAAGYTTTGVTSATEAVQALRVLSFDLLLTDLSMPELDGIGLLRTALEIDPHLGVVIMTGHGAIDTAVAALTAGAYDYVIKPFNVSDIAAVLARAVTVRNLRIENATLLEHLRGRGEQLEASNRALHSHNEELDAFTHSVAHELRSPLHAIIGFAELIGAGKAGPLNDRQQEFLGDIEGSARRMQRILEDMLRFARTACETLEKSPVNVTELVREVLGALRAAEPDRRIEVQLGKLPDVEADRALLKQVFVNLLSNAFKFTRATADPVIEVRGSAAQGHNEYVVRDNGAGFNMVDAAQLFGLFKRLHRLDEFEGTGAGLSIVKRIVERHGGRIEAIAARGRGAQFTFTLPS